MIREERPVIDFEKIKNTFCASLWTQFFIHNDGSLKLCCESYIPLIKDDGLKYINASDLGDINMILNSKFLKEIRRAVIKNEWHKSCFKCREIENKNGVSLRNVLNKMFEESIPQILNSTADDGSVDPKISGVIIRFGNLCNLKCRMCTPAASINIIGDMEKIYGGISAKKVRQYYDYKWSGDPETWEKLRNLIPDLKFVTLEGGEPLIIDKTFKFLEECVKTGHSQDIIVRYTTNMTVIPTGIEKLWKNFKNIALTCSIDGYGELNSYIRYPSKWEIIDHNLRMLDKNHKEFNLDYIAINLAVQVYNIFHLGEVLEYLFSNFNFIIPVPHFILLDNPDYLSCKILPPEMKKKAADYLNIIKEKYAGKAPASMNYPACIDSIIHYMNSEQKDNLVPVFIEMNNRWDKLRKQDVLKIAPELEGLY